MINYPHTTPAFGNWLGHLDLKTLSTTACLRRNQLVAPLTDAAADMDADRPDFEFSSGNRPRARRARTRASTQHACCVTSHYTLPVSTPVLFRSKSRGLFNLKCSCRLNPSRLICYTMSLSGTGNLDYLTKCCGRKRNDLYPKTTNAPININSVSPSCCFRPYTTPTSLPGG